MAHDARAPRVKFIRPVRVTLISGSPKAYRLKSRNLSFSGMFLEMPKPLEAGTRVALSLEAGEKVLPFAEGEVVWQREFTNRMLGRRAGFAVKFTEFSHPRSKDLIKHLCETNGVGRPLAPPKSGWGFGVALVALGAIVSFVAVSKRGAVETHSVSTVTQPQPAVVAQVAEVMAMTEVAKISDEIEVEADQLNTLPPSPAPAAPEHSVALPSGAATALTWDGAHDEFRVAPALSEQAKHTKVYLLSDPPRLVFDIDGAAPAASHSIASGERLFRRIRVGKQASATRVVIDLARAPQSFIDEDGAAIISF